MPVPVPPPSTAPAAAVPAGGLVRSRTLITAARSRTATPSDGGGTGRTDTND
ncbi:hypothetical protein [Streptomyces sp. NPDC047024]|uniref:hypothetical protein n=1 Tax=Streptomyces sp. NPDC047024 TaxID=3155476 RepID=UPI0033D65FD7